MELIKRKLTKEINESLSHFPVVAVVGPRQCGKSTLIRYLLNSDRELIYLDLERQSDLQKLDEAEWFFQSQKEKIICLDEIQRKPEIFPLIRSLVDEWRKNSSFVILGSASRDLLKQSSESLAGRISYKRLTPFLWKEINHHGDLEQYLVRGGFPGSFLAKTNSVSMEWKENFISAFIERDLMQWTGSSPMSVRRLWMMLAHNNGQTVNYSSLGNSLGVSNTTIKSYVDILQSTFMVDIVPPYLVNTGKRLVKTPKVYISDAGILTALLGLKDFIQLAGHPVFGSLWEGIVLTNLKGHFPNTDISFYRTNHGSEIDFLVQLHRGLIAIECKASKAPALSRGTFSAIHDLKPEHTFLVSPVEKGYPVRKAMDVVSLDELTDRIGQMM
ncbi:MAG TPA: ATP-binding protein [Bacteroidales bacterium]|nr:ATP-binding protein [Bacteroidales bacterium]